MSMGLRAALLFALALLPAAPASADETPCRLPRLAKAEFVTQPDGEVLVPVSVNGTVQYFELDGAPWSVIYQTEADRLGMGSHHHERDDGMFFGFGQKIDQVKARRTAELVVGKVRWREFEFYALAVPKPAGTVAIGTLGMDFLENARLDVEINLSANAINFIEADACPAPPWAPLARALLLKTDGALPVTVEGKSMAGYIYSRDENSVIDVSALAQFGLTPHSPGLQPVTPQDSSVQPFLSHRFEEIDIGDAALSQAVVQIIDVHDEAADAAFHRRLQALNPYNFVPHISKTAPFNQIALGRAELRRLRIYLMFHAGKAFVTPILSAPGTAISARPPAAAPAQGQ